MSTNYYYYLDTCFFVILLCFTMSYGFNISPNPNIVLREPILETKLPKIRSSYFGFSINLKHDRYFV